MNLRSSHSWLALLTSEACALVSPKSDASPTSDVLVLADSRDLSPKPLSEEKLQHSNLFP